jgi:hypothetical protein
MVDIKRSIKTGMSCWPVELLSPLSRFERDANPFEAFE